MDISLLLLEANDGARMAYTEALRGAGCRVTTAADSAQAYAAAVADVPDVIVVAFDAAVRDDRFGLCQRLGADARTRHVPVLLTSAAMSEHDLERATSTGVLALVLESRDAAKLVSAVRGVVAARLRPPALRASLESPVSDEVPRGNKRA